MLRRSDTSNGAKRFTVIQAAGIVTIMCLVGACLASVLSGGASPGSVSLRAAAATKLTSPLAKGESTVVAASPVSVVNAPPDRSAAISSAASASSASSSSSLHRESSRSSDVAGAIRNAMVGTRSGVRPAAQSPTVAPANSRAANSTDVQALEGRQRSTAAVVEGSPAATTHSVAAAYESRAVTGPPLGSPGASPPVAPVSGADDAPAIVSAEISVIRAEGLGDIAAPAGPSAGSAQGNVLSTSAQAAENALFSDTTGAALVPYMQAGVTPSSVIGINALSSALSVQTMLSLGFTQATDPSGTTFWVGPNQIGNPAFTPVSAGTEPALGGATP
jgi:hypothetical protein